MRAIPVAITREEGGQWLRWDENKGGVVHSIRFNNGEVWDAFNGWRREIYRSPSPPTLLERIKIKLFGRI